MAGQLVCDVSSWGSAGEAGGIALFALAEYSGFGLQQAGNYDACKDVAEGQQLCIANAIPLGSMGFCVPASCQGADFGSVASGLASFILTRSYVVAAATQNNATIVAEILSQPNAVTCGDNAESWTPARVTALVGFTLLGLLCIVATLFNSESSKQSTQTADITMTVPKSMQNAMKSNEDFEVPVVIAPAQHSDGSLNAPLLSRGAEESNLTAKCGPKQAQIRNKRTFWGHILHAFDLRVNIGNLLEHRHADKTELHVFHFFRVIGSAFVVVGHSTAFWINIGLINMKDVWGPDGTFTKWPFQWVLGAEFAVDMFFYMAGFLTFFVILGRSKTTNRTESTAQIEHKPLTIRLVTGTTQLLVALLLRWARLVPLLIAALAFTWGMLPMMGSGPFWSLVGGFSANCQQWWWTNVLFINNLVPYSNNFSRQCLGHTWYLANDMQFFIVLAACAIACKLGAPRWAIAVFLGTSTLASITAALIVSSQNGPLSPNSVRYVPDGEMPGDYWNLYYGRPWMRWPAAAIGALTFLVHNYMQHNYAWYGTVPSKSGRSAGSTLEKSLQWMLQRGVIVLALLCIGTMLTIISVTMTQDAAPGWTKSANVAYTALSKPAFVVSLAGITAITLNNRHATYSQVFGHAVFQVVGKLTYGLYLVHLGIVFAFVGASTNFPRMSFALVMQAFSATYLLSLIVAAVFYVTIESPANYIVRTLLPVSLRG